LARRDFSASEMALRGRIGAYVLHARHDPKVTTAKARAALHDRFERDVDPECQLPEAERKRRAEAARKAHYARLALASARARAKARQKKAKATVDETVAAAELEGGRHRHGDALPT
jgi:hypothetical protein